jgi:hypothetical protein
MNAQITTHVGSDLDDRIAFTVKGGVKSDDVRVLIVEAEAACIASDQAANQARTRALDPALTANDVAEARRQMEDAAFRRERLQVAVARLGERLREVMLQEKNERWLIAYEKARSERDGLAAKLKATYPTIEVQLAELLAQIEMNDREIEAINSRALPDGAERLLVAELVARDLKGFASNSGDVPRITKTLRLPAFRFDRHGPYAWPRER